MGLRRPSIRFITTRRTKPRTLRGGPFIWCMHLAHQIDPSRVGRRRKLDSYGHALPLVPIIKPKLSKIANFRKKCRFRLWREESSHARQVSLMFSMDAFRYSCRKNNSRSARYISCQNLGNSKFTKYFKL